MNANSLKRIYERMPRSVKFAFAPLFVRAMVEHPIFKRTWREIDEFEALGPQEQSARQLELLKETLTYAYNNVPFYRERFDAAGFDPAHMTALEDIQQLPLLEKSEAVAAGESIYSTEEGLDSYETFTGGSSGQTLRVLLDKDSIYRERAYVCHFLARYGYDPKRSRTVALWGHNKDADYYYSPLKNEIVISPFRLFDDTQIPRVYEDIKKFRPTFLMGYPSAITQLAQGLRRHGLSLSFQCVVYYAENYSEEDKAIAQQAFGCDVASNYGHTERAVFANIVDDECVFNDAYGYTELVPTGESNEYRIVCTGFISRKMPLVRYATDDYVVVDDQGRRRLVGHKRSDVHLVAKGGAHIFKGAMTLHVPELDKITRYQYYQNTPGEATLRLMTASPLDVDEERRVQAYLDRRTEGLLDVTIEYVDEIALTSRGKERWAICEISDEQPVGLSRDEHCGS